MALIFEVNELGATRPCPRAGKSPNFGRRWRLNPPSAPKKMPPSRDGGIELLLQRARQHRALVRSAGCKALRTSESHVLELELQFA